MQLLYDITALLAIFTDLGFQHTVLLDAKDAYFEQERFIVRWNAMILHFYYHLSFSRSHTQTLTSRTFTFTSADVISLNIHALLTTTLM